MNWGGKEHEKKQHGHAIFRVAYRARWQPLETSEGNGARIKEKKV